MSNDLPLFLRFSELRRIFFGGKISRSTIDRWERHRDFPKRIKIGDNSVAWETRLIKEWMDKQSLKTGELK
jgi:predicted DNA-binding transcriptional regulator AlpA